MVGPMTRLINETVKQRASTIASSLEVAVLQLPTVPEAKNARSSCCCSAVGFLKLTHGCRAAPDPMAVGSGRPAMRGGTPRQCAG